MYRVYTKVNFADTLRDPSQVEITDLGYRYNEEDAVGVAKQYIKVHFFRNETPLRKDKKGNYTATDFCSYGATVVVEKIDVR